MTQEDFKRQIEHSINNNLHKIQNSQSSKEKEFYRQENIVIKTAIARTLRLCFEYPELAKEYLDGLAKATMDSN